MKEEDCRQLWIQHAAKKYGWLDDTIPARNADGTFTCGWHESDFQSYYAGMTDLLALQESAMNEIHAQIN